MEMAGPEGPKSKAPRAKRDVILVERMFPSPPVRESGERCKLPQWGSGQCPGNLAI